MVNKIQPPTTAPSHTSERFNPAAAQKSGGLGARSSPEGAGSARLTDAQYLQEKESLNRRAEVAIRNAEVEIAVANAEMLLHQSSRPKIDEVATAANVNEQTRDPEEPQIDQVATTGSVNERTLPVAKPPDNRSMLEAVPAALLHQISRHVNIETLASLANLGSESGAIEAAILKHPPAEAALTARGKQKAFESLLVSAEKNPQYESEANEAYASMDELEKHAIMADQARTGQIGVSYTKLEPAHRQIHRKFESLLRSLSQYVERGESVGDLVEKAADFGQAHHILSTFDELHRWAIMLEDGTRQFVSRLVEKEQPKIERLPSLESMREKLEKYRAGVADLKSAGGAPGQDLDMVALGYIDQVLSKVAVAIAADIARAKSGG